LRFNQGDINPLEAVGGLVHLLIVSTRPGFGWDERKSQMGSNNSGLSLEAGCGNLSLE
jgi:hypothetical protein